MDYEKAYKEACEKAKGIINYYKECNRDEAAIEDLEQIFPELKEGEDEMIREEIVSYIQQAIDSGYGIISKERKEKWLAWLEKQSEHHIACSEEQMKVLDEVLNFAANHESPYWNDYIFETLNNFIRQLYIAGNNDTLNDKDEEIRKALINVFATHKDYEIFFGVSVENIIAWLKKQGEQKQFYIRFGDIPEGEKSSVWRGDEFLGKENGVSVYPAFKSTNGDIVLGLNLPITKTTLHTQQHLLEYDNRPCYLVTGDYVGKDTDGQILISNVNIIEKIDNYRVKTKKQGDTTSDTRYEVKNSDSLSVNGKPFDYEHATITQKDFAPKQELKFKVGDWLASNICNSSDLLHIIDVDDKNYEIETPQGNTGVPSIAYIDNNFHLWTIQDAKDGDVLVDEDINVIGIFEGIEGMCWHSKFYYSDTTKEFYGIEYGGSHQKEFAKPATKAQCDQLEKAMSDAGYRWNKEEKKLEKVEPKQEWSKEDERICQCLIKDQEESLDEVHNDKYGHSEIISDLKEMYRERINWLKSLKTRTAWKPSEEQMQVFEAVYDWYNNNFALSETLTSLYNDLKKL